MEMQLDRVASGSGDGDLMTDSHIAQQHRGIGFFSQASASSIALTHLAQARPADGHYAVPVQSLNGNIPRGAEPRPIPGPSSSSSGQSPLAAGSIGRDEELEGVIVQDSEGSLRYHNPTSAFHHAEADQWASASPCSPTNVKARPNRDSAIRDYQRYLPRFFLTSHQHDLALDRFFRYFSSWTQRVTPHLFYRDMQVALREENDEHISTRTPYYSPMLHNMILALGLAYAEEQHLRALTTRTLFAEEGARHQSVECSASSVATVQALALYASFHSTNGDYSLGWFHFGSAMRACYALGFNIDVSSLVTRGKLSKEAFSQRCTTFWTCFAQEVMWAIYIGREPMIPDYTIRPPEVDADTDETEWHWPHPPAGTFPSQRSYLSVTFVHTASLMQIAASINKSVYSVRCEKRLLVTSGQIHQFNDALDSWRESLPRPLLIASQATDPVLPHIIMLHLAWSWVIILLFQPFSQFAARSPNTGRIAPFGEISTVAMTRCHQASIRILQLTETWRTQHGLRFCPPTMAQVVYTAGTTFLLAAAQAALPERAKAALDNVQSCLNSLREIGMTWAAGSQKASILQRLLAEYGQTSFVPASSTRPASESQEAQRQGQLLEEQTFPIVSESEFMPMDQGLLDRSWVPEATTDDFIQSLLNQISMPMSGDSDLLALLGEMNQ
uniref:Transcription factor n=1 Tax=Tremella fuciformis TaxID=64657 RepID=D5KY18_9TREE|nr:transcription factor [Tremella fuciformis]